MKTSLKKAKPKTKKIINE